MGRVTLTATGPNGQKIHCVGGEWVNPRRATGPDGHKIRVEGRAWVDDKTGQPVG